MSHTGTSRQWLIGIITSGNIFLTDSILGIKGTKVAKYMLKRMKIEGLRAE